MHPHSPTRMQLQYRASTDDYWGDTDVQFLYPHRLHSSMRGHWSPVHRRLPGGPGGYREELETKPGLVSFCKPSPVLQDEAWGLLIGETYLCQTYLLSVLASIRNSSKLGLQVPI